MNEYEKEENILENNTQQVENKGQVSEEVSMTPLMQKKSIEQQSLFNNQVIQNKDSDKTEKESKKITSQQLLNLSTRDIQYLISLLGGMPGKSYANETMEQRYAEIEKLTQLLIKNNLYEPNPHFSLKSLDPDEIILDNLPYGGIYQGPRKGQQREINKRVATRELQTYDNVRANIGGVVGKVIGGHRGSDIGVWMYSLIDRRGNLLEKKNDFSAIRAGNQRAGNQRTGINQY